MGSGGPEEWNGVGGGSGSGAGAEASDVTSIAHGDTACKRLCCNVRWSGPEEWNGVGAGCGPCGGGFKTGEACGNVFDKILARAKALGGGWFCWGSARGSGIVLISMRCGNCW